MVKKLLMKCYFCCCCFVIVVAVVVVVVVVVHVVVDPRNLPLKFGQNRVRNRLDIAGIEFPVVVGG